MIEEHQVPLPSKDRWHILRAGLQNIWEYDDCRFVFHRGRLLLRGANESGKTKALEVLLPFLLDADLAPQRLDPFGSTSRPMRWNLLNDANRDVEVSIGYIWLEFGRQTSEGAEFCTIGAGLRAKRSNPKVDPWYFITTRRIDRDLRLMDARRIPAGQSELEDAIGDAGQVFGTASDYRRKVNDRLFGMPQEQYDTLIEALLQLRRPKLSERLDPEELSRILTASLPPLESRIIGSLAEGFQRLDRHRIERDEIERTHAATTDFLRVYRGYVAATAKARAQEVTRADSTHQKLRSEQRDCEGEHEAARTALAKLEARIAELEGDEAAVDQRLQTLRASDEYRAVAELDAAEQSARTQADHATRAETRYEEQRTTLTDCERKRDGARTLTDDQSRRVDAARAHATNLAIEAALEGSHPAVDDLVVRDLVDAARSTVESLCEDRRAAIASLEPEAGKAARAGQEAGAAQAALADAAERERVATEKLAEVEQALLSQEERFRRDVDEWLAALSGFRPDADAAGALLAAEFDDMRGQVDTMAEPVLRMLDDAAAEMRAGLAGTRQEIAATRAQHEELSQRTHAPPLAPDWREQRPTDRPGAPLYLLCDFRDPNRSDGGTIEAALESSGLLDAWVTPAGALLDPKTFDTVLVPSRMDGPTLLDLLVPIEAGGVAPSVIAETLASIRIVEGDAPEEETCWIGADGRWRLGPMRGAWSKVQPSYIGATAREQARRRQLAELAELISTLERQGLEIEAALERNRTSRRTVEEELSRFPDILPVLEKRARLSAVATAVDEARAEHGRARCRQEEAHAAWQQALAARDAAAIARGLLAWIECLDDLKERTREYRAAGLDLVNESRELVRRRAGLAERQEDVEKVAVRVETAAQEAAAARIDARRAEAHAGALRDSVGATREDLLKSLAGAQDRLLEVRDELGRRRGEDHRIASTRLGAATVGLEAARAALERSNVEREQVARRFRAFVGRGVTNLLEVELDGAAAEWTFTDTLLAARKVDTATGTIDCSEDAQDAADTRVTGKQQDLLQRLPPDIRLIAGRTEGVLEYRATFNGRPREILELVDDLAGDLAARQSLLDDEERKLFESFLTGETHQHLGARLRQANALVDRMRRELAARPTSSGMVIGLKWEVRQDAPPGTKQAIDLMLRSGHLLTDGDRAALRSFLEQRMDEANVSDGAGTLEERMLAVLDYRNWFTFTVQVKSAGQDWKALTRKEHGAGSGGQKGVMLQLPLFAAAAAFYESADPFAPRLIMLDEAFSGIDRKMRGKLMGLLTEFELDFVMTSFEEWGFYGEVDGLSTYHLSREQGMPGVHMDWFVWDGKQPMQMDV